MSSKLNPNAKEFIPFRTENGSGNCHLSIHGGDDVILAQSPKKGDINNMMTEFDIPNDAEFFKEICSRPRGSFTNGNEHIVTEDEIYKLGINSQETGLLDMNEGENEQIYSAHYMNDNGDMMNYYDTAASEEYMNTMNNLVSGITEGVKNLTFDPYENNEVLRYAARKEDKNGRIISGILRNPNNSEDFMQSIQITKDHLGDNRDLLRKEKRVVWSPSPRLSNEENMVSRRNKTASYESTSFRRGRQDLSRTRRQEVNEDRNKPVAAKTLFTISSTRPRTAPHSGRNPRDLKTEIENYKRSAFKRPNSAHSRVDEKEFTFIKNTAPSMKLELMSPVRTRGGNISKKADKLGNVPEKVKTPHSAPGKVPATTKSAVIIPRENITSSLRKIKAQSLMKMQK